MENASEALLMAGQVLIFILALTLCISSFTTVRVGIDRIMDETETIKLAKSSDLYINYVQSRDKGATRIVGAETVVSSMYRAIKEDFTMYIQFKDNDILDDVQNTLDALRTDSAGNEISGIKLIRDDKHKSRLKVTIGSDANFRSNSILANGLYEKIKNLKFEEYIGEYQDNPSSGVNSENKLVRRIITYVQQ